MSEGITKLLPADQLMADLVDTNEVPPEGDAMPPGAVDISRMNRAERRAFKKNHGIKIVGNNTPLVKPVAKYGSVV